MQQVVAPWRSPPILGWAPSGPSLFQSEHFNGALGGTYICTLHWPIHCKTITKWGVPMAFTSVEHIGIRIRDGLVTIQGKGGWGEQMSS